MTDDRRPESEKRGPCPFCQSSGKCFKCDGTGDRVIQTGLLHYKLTVTCSNCQGSGECQLCHGKVTQGGHQSAI